MAVGAGIGVVIMVVLITFHVGANPANIQIVDYRTSTPITQHYVISFMPEDFMDLCRLTRGQISPLTSR